ncbi:hypothetical protein M9Y10_043367 [Tritrichomonas musculus]|uniref:non-specific serine/threonine protein kinase n=1 Tax=Tritrichomonas musculus TaxID=1915356 RepID=A0ABR2JZN1_9EUKA
MNQFNIKDAYIVDKFNPDYPDISRYYENVNLELGRSHWDYKNWNPEFGDINRYSICEWLGSGRYSDVFKSFQDGHTVCAIKILKPVNPDRVRRELRILTLLQGGPNILELWEIVIDPVNGIPSMIMGYVDNKEWHKLYEEMKLDDIRWYTYRLLQALAYTHSQGVMHRDVKPGNILCGDPKEKLELADWGLAEFYHPLRTYSSSVGTRYYKAPELLLGYELYNYSVDIWSVGVILIEALSLNVHLFDSDRYKMDQLDTIAKIVGGQKIVDWIKFHKPKKADEKTVERLLKYKGVPFESLIPRKRAAFKDPDALDLVDKLLTVDNKERISAKEALKHPFFDSLRDKNANIPTISENQL